MIASKKIVLIAAFAALGVITLLFLPLLFIATQDLVGAAINPPFALCKIMDRALIEDALKHGYDVNKGCCTERMMGECSIARPNSLPLLCAAEEGTVENVRLLLEHGADPNKSSASGYPITVAAAQGKSDVVALLVEHKADLESRGIALRMAAHFGRADAFRLIVQKANPKERAELCAISECALVTELQQLQSSFTETQRQLESWLIETCPDPNLPCETERLLSSLAKSDANAPLIKALLDHGADLNAKEKSGKSVKEYLRSFYDYDRRPQIKSLIER